MKGLAPLVGALVAASIGIIIGLILVVILKIHVVNNIQYQYASDSLGHAHLTFLNMNFLENGQIVYERERLAVALVEGSASATEKARIKANVTKMAEKTFVKIKSNQCVAIYLSYPIRTPSGMMIQTKDPLGYSTSCPSHVISNALIALPYNETGYSVGLSSMVKNDA